MIDAYYSRGSDSSNLFDDTEIAKSEDYRKYMNQYNVIHLDISSAWDFHKEDLVEYVHKLVCEDLKSDFVDTLDYTKELYSLFYDVYKKTNIPFVIIIDECDCVIRNSEDSNLVYKYLQYTSVLKYNDENSLSCVLTMAYFTALQQIKETRYQGALADWFNMICL